MTKKKSGKKVPGSQILQKSYNVKGIGPLGQSHKSIVPSTVNPSYGSSNKVIPLIIKSF
jgi:hypothetical protein